MLARSLALGKRGGGATTIAARQVCMRASDRSSRWSWFATHTRPHSLGRRYLSAKRGKDLDQHIRTYSFLKVRSGEGHGTLYTSGHAHKGNVKVSGVRFEEWHKERLENVGGLSIGRFSIGKVNNVAKVAIGPISTIL